MEKTLEQIQAEQDALRAQAQTVEVSDKMIKELTSIARATYGRNRMDVNARTARSLQARGLIQQNDRNWIATKLGNYVARRFSIL